MFEPHREYWVVAFGGIRTYVTESGLDKILDDLDELDKGIIEFVDIYESRCLVPKRQLEGIWFTSEEIERKYHIQEKFNSERTRSLRAEIGGWSDE